MTAYTAIGGVEAEARFANAFEEAPIGMALVSPEGGFLRVNRELVRITGHTQEQLLEMSVQDVSHPDELERDPRSPYDACSPAI